ncbi:MAG: metallophosphoesterase [Bacteroidaceae bacterium]|nr:metallophosphoesterase [Bacteroidaceae bacterium]
MKYVHSQLCWLFLPLLFIATMAVAQTRTLRIVHTSDTHSCIEPLPANHPDTAMADKAGFLRREVLLRQLRQTGDNLLVLDSGDFSQGSVFYNLFKGDVEVMLMNAMRYDACTLGNHEFDFGLENLARLIRKAQFPFVCTNYDFTGTPCEGLVKPYLVVERGGVRVGIIGVSPQPEGLVPTEKYAPMRYIDPVVAVQPVIDLLRGKEGCEVVICLSHLGWEVPEADDTRLIQQTKGLDVVLGGHTHTYFEHPASVRDAGGHEVIVDHQGKNAQFVGLLELEMQ